MRITLRGVSEMSAPAYRKTGLHISRDGSPLKTFGRATFDTQVKKRSGH